MRIHRNGLEGSSQALEGVHNYADFESNGHVYEVDEDGFLEDPGIWNDDMARDFTAAAGITELTDDHWKLIRYLRDYYLQYGIAPMIGVEPWSLLLAVRVGVRPRRWAP